MREILLADDEIHICAGIRELLANRGDRYSLVAEASTGTEALALFRKFCPDIVILDVRMPGLTGLEVFEKMRSVASHVQGIFVSAHSDRQYLRTAIQCEAVDYIFKPINPQEILDALNRADERLQRLGIPESAPAAAVSRDALAQRTVEEVRHYIRSNYAKPLTIQRIAESVHLSTAYACTLYKRITRSTILQYLTEIRMDAALRLLNESDLPAPMIAQRVGYQDFRYFKQLFQKHTGVSLTTYREQQEDQT